MSKNLQFQNHTLEVLERDGKLWIRGLSICQSLGYEDPASSLTKIYNRHKDEFSSDMVHKPQVKTSGGWQRQLCFSLRGAHLLAMFSKTPVAKEFRRWVLDVLDGQVEAVPRLPSPTQSVKHMEAVHALKALYHLTQANTLSMPGASQGVVANLVVEALHRLSPTKPNE